MRTITNIVFWPFRMWDTYVWQSRVGLTIAVIWYVAFGMLNTYQGDHVSAVIDAIAALIYLLRWNTLTKRLRESREDWNKGIRTRL